MGKTTKTFIRNGGGKRLVSQHVKGLPPAKHRECCHQKKTKRASSANAVRRADGSAPRYYRSFPNQYIKSMLEVEVQKTPRSLNRSDQKKGVGKHEELKVFLERVELRSLTRTKRASGWPHLHEMLTLWPLGKGGCHHHR